MLDDEPIIDDEAHRNFRDATTPRTKADILLAIIGGIACVLLWVPEVVLIWGADMFGMASRESKRPEQGD